MPIQHGSSIATSLFSCRSAAFDSRKERIGKITCFSRRVLPGAHRFSPLLPQPIRPIMLTSEHMPQAKQHFMAEARSHMHLFCTPAPYCRRKTGTRMHADEHGSEKLLSPPQERCSAKRWSLRRRQKLFQTARESRSVAIGVDPCPIVFMGAGWATKLTVPLR